MAKSATTITLIISRAYESLTGHSPTQQPCWPDVSSRTESHLSTPLGLYHEPLRQINVCHPRCRKRSACTHALEQDAPIDLHVTARWLIFPPTRHNRAARPSHRPQMDHPASASYLALHGCLATRAAASAPAREPAAPRGHCGGARRPKLCLTCKADIHDLDRLECVILSCADIKKKSQWPRI